MPFLLHRPDSAEPSRLTERDARRILEEDFDKPQIRRSVWSKLLKGEKVFVRLGRLEWVSDATG